MGLDTSLLVGAPRVLFHVRGMMDSIDCSLLERLRFALRELGWDLLSIAHHFPQVKTDAPILCVRNGFHEVRTVSPQHGWRSWLDPEPLLPRDFVDLLLDRETAWHGPGPRATHIQAIAFYEAFYRAALAQSQPSLLLLWNGLHPQEMILDRLCRDAGIPVQYLERGLFANTLHVDSEGVLAGSSIAKSAEFSWPEDIDPAPWRMAYRKIREQYRLHGATWWEQPRKTSLETLRRKLKIPDHARVVMFAGQVDRDAQNLFFAPQYNNNLDAFACFCHALPHDQNLFILGKHHPKSDTSPQDYINVLRETGTEGVWTDAYALQDCMALSKFVAAVNSTVLYEALMLSKPVLAMGHSLLSGKGIAFEMTGRKDTTTIKLWLGDVETKERLVRWREFAAYLLANEVYGILPDAKEQGLRGLDAMAAHCVKNGKAQETSPTAMELLEEVALWDDHRRRNPHHEGVKEFLRGMHICARALLGNRMPGVLAWVKRQADMIYEARNKRQ